MDDPRAASSTPAIDIMLVSHTNVGKTTLVRTLLGRDVGEVRDAPEVTTTVIPYELFVDESLGALRLWDTPGFGDSFRLAERLRQRQRWVAWIIRELWDRFRNPPLWRGQRLALDLRQRASVILYLVDALQRPVNAVYVIPEFEILTWIGKPVLAILNQGGNAQPGDREDARTAEWHEALAGQPIVRKTLSLDSYTRCWLQELVLYDEIGHVLPDATRSAYLDLAQRVKREHQERFDASIECIAEYLLRIARDKVELKTTWLGSLQDLWDLLRKQIPWGNAKEMKPHELAMAALTQNFMAETKAVTDSLIVINRLYGVSAGEIVETTGDQFSIHGPADASKSALAGGVISGALAGLGADLLVGGLSLGSGALVGGVLGAVGAAALAKGYNVHFSKGMKVIGWSPESLSEATRKSVMLYLAIAHFGRGQGEWRRKADPAHWNTLVAASIERHKEEFQRLWERVAAGAASEPTRCECVAVLTQVLVEALQTLYPPNDLPGQRGES